jgi:hypothetical protein
LEANFRISTAGEVDHYHRESADRENTKGCRLIQSAKYAAQKAKGVVEAKFASLISAGNLETTIPLSEADRKL